MQVERIVGQFINEWSIIILVLKTVRLVFKVVFGLGHHRHGKGSPAINFLTSSAPNRLSLLSTKFYIKDASQICQSRPSCLAVNVVFKRSFVRIWN
jgi:hypothetical protein